MLSYQGFSTEMGIIYSSVEMDLHTTVYLDWAVIRLQVIRRGHIVFYLTYSPVYNRGVS